MRRNAFRIRLAWLLVFASTVPPALAGIAAATMRRFVGYTIVGVFTITGWRGKDGTGKAGEFTGCDFGRVIVFDEDKALTCQGYGYQNAYQPEAVILSKGGSYKMVVAGDIYDMQR